MTILVCLGQDHIKQSVLSDLKNKYGTSDIVEMSGIRDLLCFTNKSSVRVIVLDQHTVTNSDDLFQLVKLFNQLDCILYFSPKEPGRELPPVVHWFDSIEGYQEWVNVNSRIAVESQSEDETIVEITEEFNQQEPKNYENEQGISKPDVSEKIEISNTPKEENNHEHDKEIKNKIIDLREALDLPLWKHIGKPRVIGVWSPLHRIGVTTFVLNFALYLAKFNISIGVLEGLTNNHRILSFLEQYDQQPENWQSYASYLYRQDISPEQVRWEYEGIHWFPFGYDDINHPWDAQTIKTYVEGIKIHDLTLVDLPTGEMKTYTKDTLYHIDELWILVNDEIQIIQEWKEYIEKISHLVTCKLIFSQTFSFSRPDELSKKLGLEMLCQLPDVHVEAMKHHYLNRPLIKDHHVRNKWERELQKLNCYLFGSDYTRYQKSTIQRLLSKFQLSRGLF